MGRISTKEAQFVQENRRVCVRTDAEGGFMKKKLALLLGALSIVAVTIAPANAAYVAPDQTASLTLGQRFDWTGNTAIGLNQNYWGQIDGDGAVIPTGLCNKSILFYCDQILISFTNPLTEAEIAAGKTYKNKSVSVTIDTFTPTADPATDFDLLAFSSDVFGNQFEELGKDGSLDPGKTSEAVTFAVTTTLTQPTKYVLLHVVYYNVVNGSYAGHVTF
jgi:hypothetical protein